MTILSKIKNLGRFIVNDDFRYIYLGNIGALSYIPDREYIEKRYFLSFGRKLDLDNPVTYTEKLQWLKLYDHNPLYTDMVDKYQAKEYVKQKIGEQYVIPNLGVWEKYEDIDFGNLPEQFVLKCTHDSGSIIICRDKETFDLRAAKRKLKKYLNRDYYKCSREWPYKNVTPKIIAEPYLEDDKDGELRDYKFFTFNGEPKLLYIAQGRSGSGETTADFFDMNFNHLDLQIDHQMSEVLPHKPENFESMKRFARILSEGVPQLRVDFYEVNGHVYFGEMTFFHCSGLVPFRPEKWDYELGRMVILPEKIE